MSRRLIPMLCLSAFALAAQARSAEPPATDEAQPVPEQILVVGQKPGPGLWKVSKDDHVLWVFGSYSPLPKKMEWRSQQVESIIAQSQEFLTEPNAQLEVGFLRGLTLLPFAIGADKNPDGKTLHDLLPADTYERWLALRKRYLKDDDDYERMRPLFVAQELAQKAADAAGLSNGKDVREKLVQVAKQNKVKITSATVKLDMDSPVKALRELKKTQLDDVDCFAKTIARLDTDLDTLRARANAWSKGDIEAIRALDFSEQEKSCLRAVQDNAIMRERGLGNVDTRIRTSWLDMAEKSLAANKSTFAVVPIKHLVARDGYLAALQEKGYTVEQPD